MTLRAALMESYLAFKTADLVVAWALSWSCWSHVALGGFLGLAITRWAFVLRERQGRRYRFAIRQQSA